MNADVNVRGMDLLLRYLSEHGLTQVWLCRQIGVTEQTFVRWKRGESEPKLKSLAEIERVTRGAVPVASWVSDRD